MKKLLSMMLLVLAMTFGLQVVDESKASADDPLFLREYRKGAYYDRIYVFEKSFRACW